MSDDKTEMVMMPSALTAENGAKGLLIGEFTERKRIDCPFCEDGRSNEDGCFCHACAGTGSIDDELQVSWVTIKAIYAKAVEHLGQPAPEPLEWQPMETAPKNNTLVQLRIKGSDTPLQDSDISTTIGHNSFENTNEDVWEFAGWNWCHDCYTQGTGTPIGWKPLI